MANMNPKIENLKSNLDRTPIERQLLASKAGMASGKARKERKQMKDILQLLLDLEIKEYGHILTAKEAMLLSVVKNAIEGDLKAIEFIQSTIGEKPIYNSNSTADPQRVAEVQEIINEFHIDKAKMEQIWNILDKNSSFSKNNKCYKEFKELLSSPIFATYREISGIQATKVWKEWEKACFIAHLTCDEIDLVIKSFLERDYVFDLSLPKIK